MLKRFGYNVVDFPQTHLCCGAAGSYVLTQPELSENIIRNKMEEMKRYEFDVIITANPGCQLQLQKGVNKYLHGKKVWHFCEAIDWTYRKGRGYKEYFNL